MKKNLAVIAGLLSVCTCACASASAKPAAPIATPAHEVATTSSPAPATTSAPPVEAAPPPPVDAPPASEKPKKSPRVVLFAFQSGQPKDKGLCWGMLGTAKQLADFEKDRKKNTAEAAKRLEAPKTAKFTATCAAENVVGTCESAMGALVSYYGPTFTPATAKKHCVDDQVGTWVE